MRVKVTRLTPRPSDKAGCRKCGYEVRRSNAMAPCIKLSDALLLMTAIKVLLLSLPMDLKLLSMLKTASLMSVSHPNSYLTSYGAEGVME